MKPPPFTYHRPASVAEALAALAEAGAGRQGARRRAEPGAGAQHAAGRARGTSSTSTGSPSSAYVRADGDAVRVGALARHARPGARRRRVRRAAAAAPGHRGTSRTRRSATAARRSAASCTPTRPAEMPAVLLLLDGTVELASAGRAAATVAGGRLLPRPAGVGARAGRAGRGGDVPGAARRAPAAPGVEVSRRHGDYALCGVGALVDARRRPARSRAARAAYISVGPTPVLVDLDRRGGRSAADAADWAAAGRAGARHAVDPDDDIHATADYRRHLVGVLHRARPAGPRPARPRGRPATEVSGDDATSRPHEVAPRRSTGCRAHGPRCRPAGCCPTACATTCG